MPCKVIVIRMNENNTELSFEAALSRLEEIVRSLDGGNAPLDESLNLFEEGVKLVKLCSGKLDTAEQRVKILTQSGETDFAPMANPAQTPAKANQ